MSNTFGRYFRITTFGESHGGCVGAVVDGCPSLVELSEASIQAQLDRRRPGQTPLSSPRQETDTVRILSGVQDGVTLGSPIALVVDNKDARPSDYAAMADIPRPSHADYTYRCRYGIAATSGGGRASARETVGRVAGGAVAETWLRHCHGVDIVAWVQSVGDREAPDLTGTPLTRQEVDAADVRCPDPESAARMSTAISEAAAAGDSLGGTILCVCRGVPPGWGDPVFGKVEALLAGSMLSIPAARGFDIGSGFEGCRMPGSLHNDRFVAKDGRLGTMTNRSGGVQGGITNGEPVVFRVAFKPTATLGRAQETVDYEGRPVVLEPRGRHDPCVLPRAVPIVEAMCALVLADVALAAR